MADRFDTHTTGLDSPYDDGAAVSPDDATDLPTASRALYIGGAGTLRITTTKGTTLNFPVMSVGIHRLRAARVHATGTTATSIVALY